MSPVGGVFRNALVFGTAPALQKVAALLLLPYFTHYLKREDYGAIELIAFWTSVFVVVFGCEYRTGLLWRLAAAGDPEARRRTFTASLYFALGTALVAMGAFVAGGPALLASQMAAPPDGSLVLLLAAGVACDLVGIVLLAALQSEQRAALMVALSLVQFTVDALLKILFVAHDGRGVVGFFEASTIASATGAALALLAVRGQWTARVAIADVRAECAAVLRYSAPLLLGAFAYLLVRRIDRPMLVDALGLAAVGVYGRAARLTQLVLDFYVLPFQRSFDVWRLAAYERPEGAAQVAHTYRWFMLGAGLVATGVATFGCDLFTGLADADYVAVREQVPLLNVAALCQCGATVVASAFFVTRRTGLWMRIFVAGLAVEIVVMLLALRPFGIAGVALALTCAHGFLWWAAAYVGRGLWAVPFRHGQAIALVAIAAAVSMLRPWLPLGPLWLALCIDALLVLAYLGAALPVARVGRPEWSMLWALVRDRWSRR